MIKKLKITILVDNLSNSPALYSEHGFSLWIEADGKNILFDTGQTEVVFDNTKTLGIDLGHADVLVLSHGHFDHTGGVKRFLKLCPDAQVYCHSGALIPRYSRHSDGTTKKIGMPEDAVDSLPCRKGPITWTSDSTMITPDVGIIGKGARRTPYEDTGGAFYLDAACTVPDPIDDDISIWCVTSKGVTVITGCCHSGLVNTLTAIRPVIGMSPLHTVIGGFHLVHADKQRITATASYLQSAGISRVIPCHCTGDHAVALLQQQLGTAVEQGYGGMVIN